MIDVIKRQGDPDILGETSRLATLFPVQRLPNIGDYRVERTEVAGKKMVVQKSMDTFLGEIHTDLLACIVADSDIFMQQRETAAETTMAAFDALLPSMGLRYATETPQQHLISDDPGIDYGYGQGAAIAHRREEWGTFDADDSTTRTIVMIVLSLGSVGRSDVALELFACLVTEYYALDGTGRVVEMPPHIDSRATDRKTIFEICKRNFSARDTPLLFLVMLSGHSLIVLDRTTTQTSKNPHPQRGCCTNGVSLMRIRVRNGPTGLPITIETCPYTICWMWSRGCRTWNVLSANSGSR
jgi:hypothetical protein